ncbi:AraC family transcriptional regulator [Sphingobacterium sp.]|uniref:helix-turn-helix domain-containing protein n=1 Tax=Sphingobacterium sp. TaxID=341027 RepID=UPI0031D7E7B8
MNLSFRSEKIKHKQKIDLNELGFDFALAYISEGVLVSKNNGAKFLKENLLFLNTTSEILESKKDSNVFILYFSSHYFKDLHHIQQNFCLSYNPQDIFTSEILKNKSLSLKKENRKLIEKVIALIYQQGEYEKSETSTFIFHQVMSLFALIENMLKDLDLPIHESREMSHEIEVYIQQNIYFPDKLQIKNIADHFQISANYFGAFFKKKYQRSYKLYIDDIRTQLIEERLVSSRYTMKQIVDELGFNDESHLTNFYKKKRNITPSAYKKSKQINN